MAKRSLADRLDTALESVLEAAGVSHPAGDAEIRPLVRLAASLQGLPRQSFRRKLRAELLQRPAPGGRVESPTALPSGLREGFHSVTPYLIVPRPDEFAAFMRDGLGAIQTLRAPGSAGGVHIELRIRDSMLMAGGFAERKPEQEAPCGLHLYVEDADEVYRRALAAGATSLEEPVDQFYGDREAAVQDAFGNHWYIATHKGASFVPPALRAVTPFFHPRGAPAFIDFLKQAFNAEEIERSQSPAGIVHHAEVRIGDSVVEMGEAHGLWQPMPSAIYLCVSDVDAVYLSAVAAGGTSVRPPTDQPYGDRSAWVKDAFGHTWYIATPRGK